MLSNETLKALDNLYCEIESVYNHETKIYTMKQMLDNAKIIRNLVASIDENCGISDDGSTMKTAVLHEYLNNILNKCAEIEDLSMEMNEKFLLFVMGSGKNGKSTLINALLGQGREIAKTNFLPKTWKIDIFSDGSIGENSKLVKINIQNKNGTVTTNNLPFEKAEMLIADEERKQDASQKIITKTIREEKSKGASLEALEQLKAKLKKYDLYRSPITEVVWPVVGSDVLNDYRIVDTPGLKQELASDMVISSSKDYYGKADGVIWLLPGDKISSKADYDEIASLLKDYGSTTDNIVAVINKFDVAEAKGQGQNILLEAEKQYGKFFKTFIPVSAKNACDALKIMHQQNITDNARIEAQKKYEQSGIPALLKHLEQKFFANALDIQITSKYHSIEALYVDIRNLLSEFKQKLLEAKNKHAILEKEWNSELNSILESSKNSLKRFLDSECDRIYYEVSKEEDRLWDMEEDTRNGYIKDYLIRPQYIESNLKSLIKNNVSNLSEIYKEYVRRSSFKEFPALNSYAIVKYDDQGSIVGTTELGDITNEGDAQFIFGGALAIGAAALLGPVGLLFAGFAATDTGKSIAKFLSRTFGKSIAQKTKERFAKQMKKAIKNMEIEFRRMGNEASKNVKQVRDDSYGQLYGSVYKHNDIIDGMESIKNQTYKKIESLTLEDVVFGKK